MEFLTPETDRWTVAPADQPAAHVADQLLAWDQWLELRDRWPQELRVGVVFPNHLHVSDLVPDLPRLALVALQFPKWTDGRAYSQARLLRTRHRFAGGLRAIGDVIPDMAAQLSRTGFDAMQLRAGESIEVARRMLDFFPVFYQADVHEPRLRFVRDIAAGAEA
jgi:uncharacterized protein (DUF934 family)